MICAWVPCNMACLSLQSVQAHRATCERRSTGLSRIDALKGKMITGSSSTTPARSENFLHRLWSQEWVRMPCTTFSWTIKWYFEKDQRSGSKAFVTVVHSSVRIVKATSFPSNWVMSCKVGANHVSSASNPFDKRTKWRVILLRCGANSNNSAYLWMSVACGVAHLRCLHVGRIHKVAPKPSSRVETQPQTV